MLDLIFGKLLKPQHTLSWHNPNTYLLPLYDSNIAASILYEWSERLGMAEKENKLKAIHWLTEL
jgi:spermidine/putrescine-binding protein